MKPEEKILLVDDEPNLLAGYNRTLRKHFNLATADGPTEGLKAIEESGPFAVVVSDFAMPGMNGIEFLNRVRTVSAKSVRILLTGFADAETAIRAVNQGAVFRFLTKPCPGDVLGDALRAGIDQYRLVRAEAELLERTLKGSIKVCTDILSIVDPEAFGAAMRIRRMARDLGRRVKLEASWALEIAAMLSPIGLVTLPPELRSKIRASQKLSDRELAVLDNVNEFGHDLISNIPRLDPVAEIIRYRSKRFDGSGPPADGVEGKEIPIESRILKILFDLQELEPTGISRRDAFRALQTRTGWYDPEILVEAYAVFVADSDPAGSDRGEIVEAKLPELHAGDRLISNVETSDGRVLLAAGLTLSDAYLVRLWNYARLVAVKEPIHVERPRSERPERLEGMVEVR